MCVRPPRVVVDGTVSNQKTLDIRLGAFPSPLPPSIYCLSRTCVSYSGCFRNASRSLLFSTSWPPTAAVSFPRRIWGKVFYDVVTRCTSFSSFFPLFLVFYASSLSLRHFGAVSPVKAATLADKMHIKLSRWIFVVDQFART